MARRGRKRKSGRRHPSGKLVIEHESPRAVAAGMPHRRDLKEPLDQRGESALGRARLNGDIAEEEYLAGAEYARVWRCYVATLGGPHRLQVSDGGRIDCGGCLGLVDTDMCNCARRKGDWLAFHRALRAAGWGALLAVQQLALNDMDCPRERHAMLRLGLTALARHLRLTPAGKSDYRYASSKTLSA